MDTQQNSFWWIAALISLLIHLAVLCTLAFNLFGAQDKSVAVTAAPPPFALRLGPWESPPDQAAAKPKITPTKIVEEKQLPKLAEAPKAKPKIAVPKKEKKKEPEKKPEPIKEEPKPQPPSDNPYEHENSEKDEGGAAAASSTGLGGPRGVKSSAPVIGTSSTMGSKDAVANWNSILHTHLNKYKKYPQEANRLARSKGIVKVKVKISSKGEVLTVEKAKGSGNVYLDRAAINLVKRASPVPAPPAEVLQGQTEVIVSIPISYSQK